jgi:hypothetical protein
MVSEEGNRRIIVDNLKRSAKWHKEHCHEPDCGVSLWLLKLAIEQLGGEITEAEKQIYC